MFALGQIVFILISTASAPGIVSARGVMADVLAVTEKAVKLQLGSKETESIWLPIKALKAIEGREGDYKLAPWFKANAYQWAMIEKHSAPSFTQA